MTKINEVITKLQELEGKHGNVNIEIYESFDKKDTKIDVDEIFYDNKLKNVYIGIYN